MRYFILSVFFLALVGCQPGEQASEEAAPETAAEEAASEAGSMDPTVTESDHYAVEFENDDVRVVRVTYAANDETDMHSHPDLVAVFLGDGTYAFALEDGTEVERSAKAAEAIWMPAEAHAVKALIDNETILVEIKGSGGEVEAAPEETSGESMDPTELEPDHYKAEFENDHVRILRITYAAGDEAGLHSHPNGVLVSLSDASAALTLEDGTEREDNFTAGDTIWAPAETHRGKATTDLELILIELKGSAG